MVGLKLLQDAIEKVSKNSLKIQLSSEKKFFQFTESFHFLERFKNLFQDYLMGFGAFINDVKLKSLKILQMFKIYKILILEKFEIREN